MNKKKRINITSGESFNEYIKTKINGIFVPFNEALMEGKPLFPLFDETFINERVMTHYNDLSKKDEYVKKNFSGHGGYFSPGLMLCFQTCR